MKTYQDLENHAYTNIVKSLFPEQTKTVPRIIVWSIIFLTDLILVFWGCYHWGLLEMMFGQKLLAIIPLAAVLGIFWLQGYFWGVFRKLKGDS